MSRMNFVATAIITMLLGATAFAGSTPTFTTIDNPNDPGAFEAHYNSPAGKELLGTIPDVQRVESAKVRFCAFLHFAASIPLGIFTAAMVSRLRFHHSSAAGVTIALFGGLAASFDMALSAMVQWTLGQPGIADNAELARALYFLLFAAGGPGYSVPLGLLLAGLSIPAAAPRLLPRWLVVFGLALGFIGELSSLSLVIPRALFLIPLTRFPGFVWLIAAGFKLPHSRPGKS